MRSSCKIAQINSVYCELPLSWQPNDYFYLNPLVLASAVCPCLGSSRTVYLSDAHTFRPPTFWPQTFLEDFLAMDISVTDIYRN